MAQGFDRGLELKHGTLRTPGINRRGLYSKRPEKQKEARLSFVSLLQLCP